MTCNGLVTQARVLVIGAGVSGLTTALCLRRRGFDVHVVARDFAPRVTSVVAGALWEWPPAICGHHRDQNSLARAKGWCIESYRVFEELARDQRTGVFMRRANFYFRTPVAHDPQQRAKMNELRAQVRGFVHDASLVRAPGIDPGPDICDAYSHLAPMIDTDRYMAWLLDQVRQAGCQVSHFHVGGLLREQGQSLLRQYRADCIVNCTGLGARELCDDQVYPLRGAVLRVRNDGRRFPRVVEAHCVAQSEPGDDQSFIFIVPRGEEMLILGGFSEPHQWNLDLGFENSQQVRQMHQRCVAFLPALARAELDPQEPVRAGLRPYRPRNVRLDAEPETNIIHNYGHGGAGVTLSWGCAQEACQLAQRHLGFSLAPAR